MKQTEEKLSPEQVKKILLDEKKLDVILFLTGEEMRPEDEIELGESSEEETIEDMLKNMDITTFNNIFGCSVEKFLDKKI